MTGSVRWSRRRFLRAGAAGGLALLGASCGGRAPSPRPSRALLPEQALPILAGPAPGPGRIERENRLPGTDLWQLPLTGTGDAEGYFDQVSVVPGAQIALRARSSSPSVSVFVYRLGWYGGAGGRLVGRWIDVPVPPQPAPVGDPSTGLLTCDWSAVLHLAVPPGWVSGTYVAVLQPAVGDPQWTTFIVREAPPAGGSAAADWRAPVLLVSAVTTEQAYNAWGGRSLYADNSTGPATVAGTARAVKVSFDRPYQRLRGAGMHLGWELPLTRWLERHGYDAGTCADLDLGRDPSVLTGRRLVIVAGHPEYWSVPMRSALEQAIAAGTNVAFLSGDEMYWRIRFEASSGAADRTVVCYRDPSLDPLAASHPDLATAAWGQPPDPRPEGLVVGLSYGDMCARLADMVVSAPDHWVFAGTGLGAGDRLPLLVGTEYDAWDPDAARRPAGVQVLCASPVLSLHGGADVVAPPASDEANAAIYTAPSGATVFAAGTMIWGWGLDGWGDHTYQGDTTPVDARVARITANILDRLGT